MLGSGLRVKCFGRTEKLRPVWDLIPASPEKGSFAGEGEMTPEG